LHELQHARLAEHILENHPVGSDLDIGLPARHACLGWVVQVRQQHLIRQAKWPAQMLANGVQAAIHLRIDGRHKFRSGLNGYHALALLIPVGAKNSR
jgi:hypothetical protein